MSWTKEQIVNLLNTNDRAVERALVAIFNRQTQHEQSSETTDLNNGVGFGAFDAKTGTYLAKWIISGRHLSGEYVAKGRKIALKYTKQLIEIAEEKAGQPKQAA